MAQKDRVRVKVQCLRLLLTLKLDPAKSELIYLFMERYLQLSGKEQQRYNTMVDALPQTEKEKTMELASNWRLEGRVEGKTEMLLRQIAWRFGDVPMELQTKLHALSPVQLDEMAVALFDFASFADVETRIAQLTRDL